MLGLDLSVCVCMLAPIISVNITAYVYLQCTSEAASV
jgi:hypothetical protein